MDKFAPQNSELGTKTIGLAANVLIWLNKQYDNVYSSPYLNGHNAMKGHY